MKRLIGVPPVPPVLPVVMLTALAALASGVFSPNFSPRAAGAAEDKPGDKAGDKAADKAPDKSAAGAPDKPVDKAAMAVVDKAVEALGGREKLSAVKAATWKIRGKITIDNNDNDFTATVAVSGLHCFREEFQVTVNGEEIKGATVLNDDQAWRRFNGDANELDKDALANERRSVYLQVVAADPLVLELPAFKVESAGEEKVDGKPAAVLKVKGPDGKEFTMYFDKESGLPVRQVAKVAGWDGEEYTQDATFAAYKEFDGVKKATKIELKKDGGKFISYDVTDFKPLTEKLPAERFAEPK
jgi:zinc protease